jgi:hypothetical protein
VASQWPTLSSTWPARTERAVTVRTGGRNAWGGVATDGSPTAENWHGLGGNALHTKAKAPLHQKRGGKVGRGQLTGEAVGAAATDGVEGGNDD